MIKHPYMVALDPPGAENRRWRCGACKAEALLRDLCATDCPTPDAQIEYRDELDAVLAGKR